MSTQELREALDGPAGALDLYLEMRKESAIKADIRALLGDSGTQRERFAAMAMQGCLALPSEHRTPQVIATEAVMMADALIAELAKPKEYPLDEYGHQVRP